MSIDPEEQLGWLSQSGKFFPIDALNGETHEDWARKMGDTTECLERHAWVQIGMGDITFREAYTLTTDGYRFTAAQRDWIVKHPNIMCLDNRPIGYYHKNRK